MSNQYHFLYVEDDPTSRMVMEMLIIQWFNGTKLTLFEDSSNFLPRLEALSPQPDLIFLDIHMKPHTGFELLDMLRDHRDYGDCIVVALTASVMNEEVDQLRQCGFNGAIAKPLNREIFGDLVSLVISGEPVWYVS